jgi:hypothetical protein
MYAQDFMAKVYPGSPYRYIEGEGKVQYNFNSNMNIGATYTFRQEIQSNGTFNRTQWINLRLGIIL